MRKLESTIDLLEAMKEQHGWTSDAELARHIGVPQQTVASWRTGDRSPGDEHALKIAEALDTSPLLVIAIGAAERSKNVRNQRIWRKVAEEVAEQIARGTVSAVAALALFAASYEPAAKAAEQVCILSKTRRRPMKAAAHVAP